MRTDGAVAREIAAGAFCVVAGEAADSSKMVRSKIRACIIIGVEFVTRKRPNERASGAEGLTELSA